MSKPKLTPEEISLLIEISLIEGMRDNSLTKAVAHYVHSQCATGTDGLKMLVSLLDVGAVLYAAEIYRTPPVGSVCKVISGMEHYFHNRVHEELEILSEANKK